MQAEARTHRAAENRCFLDRLLLRGFLPLLQTQLLLHSSLVSPARFFPSVVPVRMWDSIGQGELSALPQLLWLPGRCISSFIPELPQESRGLPRVRESIIRLDFRGCALHPLLVCVQDAGRGVAGRWLCL